MKNLPQKFLVFAMVVFVMTSCSAQRNAKKSKSTTASTTSSSPSTVESPTAANGKKPNILFILVDDYGWRDVAAYGSTFYETPNMDKLIGQSLKFTQAYSTYPRCVPSRYSIMTGSHPARLKGDGEGKDGEAGFTVHTPNISIGQAMKNNGYQTFYIGKWHLGGEDKAPNGVGFDQSIAAGQAGATSSHFAPYNEKSNGSSGKEKPITDLDNAPKGEYLTDRLTDEAINLLKEDAKKDKPFFGILAHYAVHTPIQAKEEYINYFKEKLRKNPTVAGADYEPESAGETKLKQDNVTYAAMIKSVDDGVGKIMKALEDLGIANNTIIIITSDHGGLASRGNKRELATSNKPLRAGKGNLYEGGVRVPYIIKWPGVIKGGTETNSIIQGVDNFATLVDIAGGKMPSSQINDGKSFYDVIKNGKSYTDRTIFWHNGSPRPTSTADIYSSAIRKGDYKLVDLFALGKKELYNIKKDIGEQNDIAAANPKLVDELYAELDAWRKKIGADMKINVNSLSEKEKAAGVQVVLTPEEQRKADKKAERKAAKKEEKKEARKENQKEN
jgi:arylsulfatase A-like enzyme